MNIASRLKTLAMCMSAGLLFVASASYAAQFTYIPSNLKVTLSNSAGQTDSLSFQQGGKLEVAGTTTNSTSINIATTGAYGLPYVALASNSSSTVTSSTAGTLPEQVNSSADTYFVLSGLVSLNNLADNLSLQSGAGGVPPYTLQDNVSVSISGNGVSIPTGTYQAGTKFAVSGPVSVTNAAGKSETDTFTGKIELGQVRGIYDGWGNLVGTRLIEIRVVGTLTDSTGNTYKVDQIYGQNDLNGITPDQITLHYSLAQQ
jgi:hypothetical protein